jgi:hypothetical protein
MQTFGNILIKSKCQQRPTSNESRAWSMCSDKRAWNRMPEQCTIIGSLLSGLTKNGDKCSHSEPESGTLYYSSSRYAKTTAASRRKRFSQFVANALL